MNIDDIMKGTITVNVDHEVIFRRGSYTIAIDPGGQDWAAACIGKQLEDGVMEIAYMGTIKQGESWISPQLGYIDRFSIVVSRPIGKPTQLQIREATSLKDWWPLSLALLDSIT